MYINWSVKLSNKIATIPTCQTRSFGYQFAELGNFWQIKLQWRNELWQFDTHGFLLMMKSFGRVGKLWYEENSWVAKFWYEMVSLRWTSVWNTGGHCFDSTVVSLPWVDQEKTMKTIRERPFASFLLKILHVSTWSAPFFWKLKYSRKSRGKRNYILKLISFLRYLRRLQKSPHFYWISSPLQTKRFVIPIIIIRQ